MAQESSTLVDHVSTCCMDAFAAEQSLRDAGLSSLMVLDTYSPITEVRCSNQSRDVISSGAPSNTVRRGMPYQHRHVSRLMALTISGRGVTAATAERRGAAASRSPSWRCAEIAILAENRRRNYIGGSAGRCYTLTMHSTSKRSSCFGSESEAPTDGHGGAVAH